MSEQAQMRVNINLAEVSALFDIAARAPMTEPEKLWFQSLLARWQQSQPGPQAPVAQPVDNGQETEAIPQARGDAG